MKKSAKSIKELSRQYLKVIEWSTEDNCYIGSAPPIIGHACHGRTEAEVLAQLTGIVETWVETLLAEGNPLRAGTAGKSYSGKFLVRVPPAVHQKVALRAESLNQYIADTLAAS